jgi:hypothetical protein
MKARIIALRSWMLVMLPQWMDAAPLRLWADA